MDTSPPAGDGEKLDMLIKMLSKMNERIEKLDERVKDIEMENDESTIALKTRSKKKKLLMHFLMKKKNENPSFPIDEDEDLQEEMKEKGEITPFSFISS